MTLIETKTLGSSAASIEFTSIPQDGTDLLALTSLRTDQAGAESDILIEFNSSNANFALRYLAGGGGAGVYSGTGTNRPPVSTVGNGATANTFSNNSFYIFNYAGSTNKSYSLDGVAENNSTTGWQLIQAGIRSNTAAITSWKFLTFAGNFVSGTTISLYKITKGSSGGVVVS
jgi:hypothetical protein